MSNSQKVILAGLVGAAAGAIAGVLLAPAEGKKTRQRISDSVQDLSASLSQSVEDLKSSVSNLVKNGTETAKEFASNANGNIKAGTKA